MLTTALEQRVEAELPGRVPLRGLEVRCCSHEVRAFAGDEGVVDRIGRRRAARVTRGLFETGAGQVVAQGPEVARGQFGVVGLGVDEAQEVPNSMSQIGRSP